MDSSLSILCNDIRIIGFLRMNIYLKKPQTLSLTILKMVLNKNPISSKSKYPKYKKNKNKNILPFNVLFSGFSDVHIKKKISSDGNVLILIFLTLF